MPRPAVFLDRDGVLNRRKLTLVRKAAQIRILPGAPEAAARLSRAGFALVIVTNQEWVGRRYIAHADHQEAMDLVERALAAAGAPVLQAYAALSSAHAKPRPDMLLQAAREHDLDLARSFMVGDNAKDILAGKAAGARTVLVDPRWRTRWQGADRAADHVARDLGAAAEWILRDAGKDYATASE